MACRDTSYRPDSLLLREHRDYSLRSLGFHAYNLSFLLRRVFGKYRNPRPIVRILRIKICLTAWRAERNSGSSPPGSIPSSQTIAPFTPSLLFPSDFQTSASFFSLETGTLYFGSSVAS